MRRIVWNALTRVPGIASSFKRGEFIIDGTRYLRGDSWTASCLRETVLGFGNGGDTGVIVHPVYPADVLLA